MNFVPMPYAYGNFPGWGEVVTSEYGQPEAEIVPEADPVSLPQLVEAVVYSFQTVGQDEGLRVAAENSEGQGPALVLAATEYIQTRRYSDAELEQRIGQLRAEEARAIQQGRPNEAQIAAYKIEILRRRQSGIESGEEPQAVRDMPGVAGETPKWKERLPIYASIASLLSLAIAVGIIQVKRKR